MPEKRWFPALIRSNSVEHIKERSMEPSKSDEQNDLVFDYKALRLMVGAIAFLLPWVVIVVTYQATSSISASYHTKVRDIFVGSLFVIGALLVAYNGHKIQVDEKSAGTFWGWISIYWKGAKKFRMIEREYEERAV